MLVTSQCDCNTFMSQFSSVQFSLKLGPGIKKKKKTNGYEALPAMRARALQAQKAGRA